MNEMRKLMEAIEESMMDDLGRKMTGRVSQKDHLIREAHRIAKETIARCEAGLETGTEDYARESLMEILNEMRDFAKWLREFK